jgi:hypothetical protein
LIEENKIQKNDIDKLIIEISTLKMEIDESKNNFLK